MLQCLRLSKRIEYISYGLGLVGESEVQELASFLGWIERNGVVAWCVGLARLEMGHQIKVLWRGIKRERRGWGERYVVALLGNREEEKRNIIINKIKYIKKKTQEDLHVLMPCLCVQPH